MLIYIAKSIACLALLWGFYKIFLERESIHAFKRFFLLGSIIAAFVIPLITFVQYVELPPQTYNVVHEAPETILSPLLREPEPVNYWPLVLWGIYSIGLLLFGYKFIKNLGAITYKIRINPKLKMGRFTNVLLREKVAPHTFLKYIFLNRQAFEAEQIPKEVLIHERAHALQRHSWDILFIELLQVIFWFNPFVYAFKTSIRLNHEFLADQAVLKQGTALTNYQKTLLYFASGPSSPALSNTIYYSSIGAERNGSIKKRFTIMKKKTSKNSMIIRGMLLLPILGLLTYGFSDTKVIQTEPAETPVFTEQATRVQSNTPEKDNYYAKVTFKFKDKNGTIIRQASYSELTPQEKSALPEPHSLSLRPKKPSEKDLNDWKDKNMYGIWLDGKRMDNDNLSDYKPSDFGTFIVSELEKNAKNYGNHLYQVNLYSQGAYKKQSLEILQPLDEGVVIYIPDASRTKTKVPPTNQSSVSNKQNDSLKLIKDWYITIDGKKYYYLRDANRVWHYYDSNKKEVKLDIVAEYLKKYNTYNTLKDNGTHYVDKSKNEQILLDVLFSELGGMCFRMSPANRPKIKRPVNPYAPYLKFVVNGKTVLKKPDELTEEDKKLIPPPPPAPSVSQNVQSSLKSVQPITQKQLQSIPPPPPPYKVPERGKVYSKELLKALEQFQKAGVAYGKAIAKHKKEGGNTVNRLNKMYENLMVLYNNYVELAIEEKLMTPRPPQPTKVLQSKGRQIPPPPPPAPKTPIEHLKEMVEKDAEIYFEGKEITSDKALEILKKSKKIRVLTRHEGLRRPIVELSSKSYFHPIPTNQNHVHEAF